MCSYHVHAFTIYDQLNYSGQMNTINTHFVVGGSPVWGPYFSGWWKTSQPLKKTCESHWGISSQFYA